jgi:hypothetical protein
MSEQLHVRLKSVRTRQQWLFALHAAAQGLLVGSCLAIAVSLLRLVVPGVSPWTSLALPLVALVGGLVFGLAWRRSWKAAAAAVDSHYKLKDRAITALAFADKGQATELHKLQVADALRHLERVDARQVAPWKMPRPLPYALGALAVAVVMLMVTGGGGRVEAAIPEPLPEIVSEAQRLEENMLEELEKLNAAQQDPRLEQLIEELKELVQEMKEPGVDQREALAKLSEMQAAVAAAQAEYNLEAVDAQLQNLGDALSPATAMKGLSQALKEGKYDKAAKELEELDPTKLDRKEAKAVSGNLKKLAKDMKDAGQGQLSDATSELAEGLESENESQCKGGACKLAGMCQAQGLRKSIGQCLGCQLGLLAECKGNCQGNKSGNNPNVARSNSPKNTWGTGASGQPLTDESTSIAATRNRQEITGTQGDGPSEKETSHSPEGREQASRAYKEKYQEYRKTAESVLDSEPLPLGHRQTIRRYFESIRPQNGEAEDVVE